MAVERRLLILEAFHKATGEGLSRTRAAEALNVSLRTLERWEAGPRAGARARAGNPIPHNALLPEEHTLIRELVASEQL
ncbi:MAG: hypothetical protein GWN12_17110, partial [Thermoplasmata archaeon]|nr:hypothetical protein [Thermoplasmata archaeon]NIW90447.1 hypothetical protein [Thermoplasmata archaeon]NIY05629.1 hypothetical protein [Thermoplasmata archaeon]